MQYALIISLVAAWRSAPLALGNLLGVLLAALLFVSGSAPPCRTGCERRLRAR